MASTRMCECGHSEGLHNFRDFIDAEPCGMPGCDCDCFCEAQPDYDEDEPEDYDDDC